MDLPRVREKDKVIFSKRILKASLHQEHERHSSNRRKEEQMGRKRRK